AEDGIRDFHVTGVQTCALPIYTRAPPGPRPASPGPGPARPSPDAACGGGMPAATAREPETTGPPAPPGSSWCRRRSPRSISSLKPPCLSTYTCYHAGSVQTGLKGEGGPLDKVKAPAMRKHGIANTAK